MRIGGPLGAGMVKHMKKEICKPVMNEEGRRGGGEPQRDGS